MSATPADIMREYQEYQARAPVPVPAVVELPQKPLFVPAGELIAKPKPIDWLIKGIAEQDSTVLMFGASGTGKSFVALSMACSIATGRDWYGHKVSKGTVAYVAGEGIPGIRRRVAAWYQDSGATIGAGLYVARHALLPEETDLLTSHLLTMPDLRLVVFDTVQRTMDGDENSTRDASNYIRALDSIREALPGVSIMLVHHSGHQEGRARGSVVFKASADLEMMIAKGANDSIVLSCTKAKEAEPFSPLGFAFRSVELAGWGTDDEPVTSAVLDCMESLPVTKAQDDWRKKIRGANHNTAITILETMAAASDTGWVKLAEWRKEVMEQTGIKKQNRFTSEVAAKLEEKGIIRAEADFVCFVVGKYAREELRAEPGRIGQKREELQNKACKEEGRIGQRVIYNSANSSLSSLPDSKKDSALTDDYEEVVNL